VRASSAGGSAEARECYRAEHVAWRKPFQKGPTSREFCEKSSIRLPFLLKWVTTAPLTSRKSLSGRRVATPTNGVGMTPTPGPAGSLRDRAPAPDPRRSEATEAVLPEHGDDATELIKAEMRAPLRALQIVRTTREEGDLSPDLDHRMVQHTKTLARRLSLLLEDLVLVSAPGQERLVLELQDLRLSTHVARAASLVPDLPVQVEGDLEVSVRADSLRLQQLLANLIRSAQRGGARPLRLRIGCVGDTVTVELPDARAGRGYELDLVRQLAQAHRGRLGHRDDGIVVVSLPRGRHPRR
jgi:signal transduction histidine kinase